MDPATKMMIEKSMDRVGLTALDMFGNEIPGSIVFNIHEYGFKISYPGHDGVVIHSYVVLTNHYSTVSLSQKEIELLPKMGK